MIQDNQISVNLFPFSSQHAFADVMSMLSNWMVRFPHCIDSCVYSDLAILFSQASREFLKDRSSSHLFRLLVMMRQIQKKLSLQVTFSPHLRHQEVRWISTELKFPFSTKHVLGCLIGFNSMDRYEVFDEENVILALQKYLPGLQLVKESFHYHNSEHKTLKLFYFEIEKKNGIPISQKERVLLKNVLADKVKNSIQQLAPTIFMGSNDEETYKNLLTLSQEIQSLEDLPQAYISLEQQTRKEIVFRLILVHISPFHSFSLNERFLDCQFLLERTLIVRHIENHPIQAHIFRLKLPREASLLRSDGSLNFYAARQKVVSLLIKAIGEFRDYNGGILIKRQELLESFKSSLELTKHDHEYLEAFFYGLIPVEKQTVLPLKNLNTLFYLFQEGIEEKISDNSNYSIKIQQHEDQIYLIVRANDSDFVTMINAILLEPLFATLDFTYNIINTKNGFAFNCVLLDRENSKTGLFVDFLQDALQKWQKKLKRRQFLKIGIDSYPVSLDPRIGGEAFSGDILKLLFEGLTRFNKDGRVENALAETIEISFDLKHYLIKLRSTLWNDGFTHVSAYDFEYAWKKILSPDFKTAFAYLFYPIKNAKEAKEGLVSLDQIGIKVIDERTLKIELVKPNSYFLQLLARPLYSPVHRLIDQQYPQWPYQSEKNYPCNGPFQLKTNQSNHGYQLVKNPFYWDASHIVLDQISLTVMNPVQAIQAFHRKEIDWIGNPFGGWDSMYSPDQDSSILSFPDRLVCWFVFNTKRPPFNNCKLRQAFAYALNRDAIVANAFISLNPAYSPLLPHFHQNQQARFPEYDINKARQLFDEALNELNLSKKDLLPFSVAFNEKGVQKYIAPYLKTQIKACFGLECELTPLTWSGLFHKMNKGDYQIGLTHWASFVNDPLYTLNAFKSTQDQPNFVGWEHPGFQYLINLSEKEMNPYQHSSLLLKAEEILSKEMPIIPLFYQPQQALIRKNLHVTYQSFCGSFDVAKSFYKTGDI